jgi:prepilin-type processing-associated H-X9-DG protein
MHLMARDAQGQGRPAWFRTGWKTAVLLSALAAALVCRAGDPAAGKKQGDDKEREARNRKASANNLAQFGLALHSFGDANKRLPPPAICSKEGKPLLSWRVAILPFIEQNELYKQFKLDEPWDSPHNKKLLAKMPKVFAPVGGKTKQPHTTFYQAIVGRGAAWELTPRPNIPFNAEGVRWPVGFRDGTSNTILLVETGEAVPWTKPDDVRYDPKKKPPKLGGVFKGGFHVLMADGSVRFVSRDISEATLRAAITRDAGDLLGKDWD